MPEQTPPKRTWLKVALPLAVLAVALIIGSGVLHRSPETSSQRASAIEADVRCPSCTDVSVADSDESTAIAVRHQIARLVDEGHSTAQIDDLLVSQYGQTILLVPPTSDGIPLIWIIPIVLAAGAVVAVLALFWRRSRQFSELKGIMDEQ
jgi:cytochrome c-type biogenesis protein CcmH